MENSKQISLFNNFKISLTKQELLFEKLLKLANKNENENVSEITYSKNPEKNIAWRKYFYYKKPLKLLFSIDQFLFEFFKKVPQRKKFSAFKLQLKEIKKLKIFYGSLPTRQLLKILQKSFQYPGYFSKNFLSLLERRLDVILYRSNFTKNIYQARQLISHRKILVNNSIVTSPSYTLNPGDIISIEKKTSQKLIENLKKNVPKLHSRFPKNQLANLLQPNNKSVSLLNKKDLEKQIYSLIQLLVKKIQLQVNIEFLKNPYFIYKKPQFLTIVKYKSSVIRQNEQEKTFLNQKLENITNQQKNNSEFTNNKNQFSVKYYYRNILFNILKQLELPSISHNLIILKLEKFLKKKPSKRQIHHSIQYYGLKPLHLEISYSLMKIIYLYSPQRIYYPFYIDVDALKRYQH
jgi:ribosomal protein S4